MSAAPRPAPHPAEVLLGLGNTVDHELVWDDRVVSGLLHEQGVSVGDGAGPGPLETEADLLRALLLHLREGTGGEHFAASPEVLLRFASRFARVTTIGGTNVRAALALRALGRPSTVHLVSTNEQFRRLLPDDVATVSSAQEDTLDPHVIVQFPGGATVQALDGPVTAPRPDRVIFTNDAPNRELRIAEAFGDAVARARVVLLSGFNSLQDPDLLERRLADVLRHLTRRADGSVVVYEHSAFHVRGFSDRVREVLGPHVDLWSGNEDELQAHVGRTVDLLDPVDVLAAARRLHADVGAPSLVVHTRHWALAVGGPSRRREAVLAGGTTLAAARCAFGDALQPSHLRDVEGWPLQAEGARFAAAVQALGEDVSCRPAHRVPTVAPTTIGLGDTFVGGVVAALAELEVATARR
jgi:ADP-dependent phosphofructokinase/glucokinase